MAIRHCQKCGLKVIVGEAQAAISPLFCQACAAAPAPAPPPKIPAAPKPAPPPPPPVQPIFDDKTITAALAPELSRLAASLAPAAPVAPTAPGSPLWRHYALLEREVRTFTLEVEWDPAHFPVYSPRLLALLGRVGLEAEALCKALGIDTPRALRQPKVQIGLRGMDRKYAPFDDLGWWSAWENVRRSRSENAKQATFEAVVKGLGAVLWLTLLASKDPQRPVVDLPPAALVEFPHSWFELPAALEGGTLRLRVD